MSQNIYVTNPETGRRIRVGGNTFNYLTFSSYDYINQELIRRASASPPALRQYFLNTQTNRLIMAGSRRYQEMIRGGWDIIEDYYLIPPGDLVAETIAMVQELGNQRRRDVPLNRPLTYEDIMDRHRDRLIDLNISLCRECFIPIKRESEYCEDCIPAGQ